MASARSRTPREAERDEKKAEMASACIKGFMSSNKKLALYLHQQSGLEDFFKSTMADFTAFHKAYGHLTVVVAPFDFFFDGESVFRADSQENSPTYKMYRAGIRSLTFERGLTATDAVALGRLFLKTPADLRQEDMASLLWRESIPHVSYLQIHSSDEDELGEGLDDDGNIEQLMSLIEEKFNSKEARNKVNFRSFSASDLKLDDFLDKTHTQRKLFDPPRAPSAAEVGHIREILAKESEELIIRGSELLFFLCKHAQNPKDLHEIEDSFQQLCERLYVNHEFMRLAQLLDAIEQLAGFDEAMGGFTALKERIFSYFADEEQFQLVIDYLENVPSMRLEERNDICTFMRILGRRIFDRMLVLLPSVSPQTRRVFLLVLVSTSLQPQTFALELLDQYDMQRDFIIDLLHVARELPSLFSREQLQEFLEHKDSQVQKLALGIFISEYPHEIADIAGGFFAKAKTGILRTLFEVLCQTSDNGIEMLFSFVKTKRFRKMSEDDREALYRILGRSQTFEVLDRFNAVLEQKSRWYSRWVDEEKHLAIRGLEEMGSFEALAVLQQQNGKPHHSPRIQKEIAHSLTFYHIYLKASKAPKKAQEDEDRGFRS